MMLEKLCEKLDKRLGQLEDQPWLEGEALVDSVTLSALRVEELEAEVLPRLVAITRRDAQLHGFSLPQAPEPLREVLADLSRNARKERPPRPGADSEPDLAWASRSRIGIALLRSIFPSYWAADNGPSELILDEAMLRPIVAFRIGINNKRETYDYTKETLRRGFISGRKVVSTFKPLVAARLMARYLPVDLPPVVWDPSAGFGARLLGFAAAFPRGTYIGNEPATRTMADLQGLSEALRNVHAKLKIELQPFGSEVHGPCQPVSLVLTSPPYYDKERYFDEPTQCWRRFQTEQEWEDRFLTPTMRRGAEALRPGGRLILNVDNEREPAVLRIAESLDLVYVFTERLPLGLDHFQKAAGRTDERSEPVIIFEKRGNKRLTVTVEGSSGRYSVCDDGTLTSYAKSWAGAPLSGCKLPSGYQAVGLTFEGESQPTTHLVHRLVCAAIHGPPPSPDHTDVRHLDGDKGNNQASNLAWGTRSENMLDVVRHREQGTSKPREDAQAQTQTSKQWYQGRTSDLELVQVCIDLFLEKKLTQVDISRILGCTEAVAGNLLHGRTLSTELERQPPAKAYRTPSRKAEIRELIKVGRGRDEVNRELGEQLTPQEFYYYKQSTR